MATGSVALDTTQYVRINVGYTSMLLQAHRDDVTIAFAEAKPAKSNVAVHTLGGRDAPLPIPVVDTNVWALAKSNTSSLIVTEADDNPNNPKYKAAEIDDAASPNYFGFITARGEWYILKMTTAAPKQLRFAKGASDFATSWTGRAGLSYDYLDVVF